jgi:hypothetical protein
MFAQLVLATGMVLATVTIHGGGLAVFGRVLRLEQNQEVVRHVPPLSPRTLAFTLILVLGLFALHGMEIWLYAIVYLGLGALHGLETAVFLSTIAYGGAGFGGTLFGHAWRLVAAIEGINGVLLMGWSTAFFVTVITRLGER